MNTLYIFDFDGTIVQSMQVLLDTINYTLHKYKYKTLDILMSEYKNDDILISGLDLILNSIISDTVQKDVINTELVARLKEQYLNCNLMDGLQDFLNDSKNAPIPKVILTCNKKEVVQTYLNHVALSDFFEDIIASENLINGKKDSNTFSYVMNKYNIKPENCTVFEDSKKPMLEAKKAGANCIYIDANNSNGENIIGSFTDLL